MKKMLHCTLCCALVLFSARTVLAQITGNPAPKAPQIAPFQNGKPASKLSAGLRHLQDTHAGAANITKRKAKPSLPGNGLSDFVHTQGDRVLVEVTLKGDAEKARAELEKLGMQVTAVFGRLASGLIPIDALPQLEAATQVRFAQPAYKPIRQSYVPKPAPNGEQGTKIKPVISQGDTAQRSHLARKKYKVSGKGVKVGILSDSYNNLESAGIGVRNGELPGADNPLNFKNEVQVLKELESGGTDEGRAMAEIVHDVAPGAELAFYTAFLGQVDFAQGILELEKAGCKVMVDDVVYPGEPFFQDGIVAQAVDMVKEKGVAYFSSAQNQGLRSYESAYRPSTFEPFGPEGGFAHNFSAPTDPPLYFQPVYIPANGFFVLSFQWDQPFYSAGSRNGSESDLDIYLLNGNGEIVAAGFDDNIASGDPIEQLGFFNETGDNFFYLLITKFTGPDPKRLKYISYRDGSFVETTPAIPGLLAPTLVGHAKAEGAIATGAAFYLETPAYGARTPRVEFFSSTGGVPNYFDKKGTRTQPEVRKKPEITAPDGANTSFFDPLGNGDIEEDPDLFPNFFGTSAAAPHAAAVAALMIEAQKLKTITPEQIKGVLSAKTMDMDDPHTPGFDKGFDFTTGTGLIKADEAVALVRYPNRYVKDLQVKALCSDNPATARNWSITNPNPFAVEVQWVVAGLPLQYKKIKAQPGTTTLATKPASYWGWPIPTIMTIDWKDNFGFPRLDGAYSANTRCNRYVASGNNRYALSQNESGLKLREAENKAYVFPNPARDHISLYLSLAEQQNAEIELFDITGRRLYKKTTAAQGTVRLNTAAYQPGVYMLKVTQGAYMQTFKVVKQ